MVAALLGVWTLAPSATAGLVVTGTVNCGDTITANTTLLNDLTDCPDDGIVIGADDITLNLNGHTIDGDATPGVTHFDRGVRLEGHHDVTIENGTVQQFDGAVGLDAATGNLVRQLTVQDSLRRGIELVDGSDGNRVEDNHSLHNGRSGIALVGSNNNVVTGDRSEANTLNGIFGDAAGGNQIFKNVLDGNDGGISLGDGSNDNLIQLNVVTNDTDLGIGIDGDRNTVTGNRLSHDNTGIGVGGDDNTITQNLVTDALQCEECGIGIQVGTGMNNLVAGNRVDHMSRYGIEVDAFDPDNLPPSIGNVVRGNTVHDAGDGIAVGLEGGGEVRDTLIEGNVTSGSTDDGINVGGPSTGLESTTLTRNVAVHNGDLGIEAIPGVIDGGGNHAAGNGNPAQCTNVSC